MRAPLGRAAAFLLLLRGFACSYRPTPSSCPGTSGVSSATGRSASSSSNGSRRPCRTSPLFFVLAFAGVGLIARAHRFVSPFAALAFLATVVAGLFAARYGLWAAILAAAVLPSALDDLWRPEQVSRRRRLNRGIGSAAAVAALAALVVTAAHDNAWFERAYPHAGADVVAAATRAHPGLRVFANERYADWLLFEDPQLAGKVAYDDRLELLSAAQLTALAQFRSENGAGWQHVADGYGLLALDPSTDGGQIRYFLAQRGVTVAYRSAELVVLTRPTCGGPAGSDPVPMAWDKGLRGGRRLPQAPI